MPQDLDGAAVSVHELLVTADRRFRAPEFQRHYVWRTEGKGAQIPRFWEDFERLRAEAAPDEGNDDSLFMGAIVLQVIEPLRAGRQSVPLFAIIDGQQRLTTLYLIFAALAEAFEEMGNTAAASDIEREYLLVRASALEGTPRLEPTISDTAQFRQILDSLNSPKPKLPTPGYGPADHHLTRAWHAIRAKVRSLCADDTEPGNLSNSKLEELLADIADRIELVAITLGERHDPHEVYERLNTAGEPLGAIDFTRNAVFLTAGASADAAQRIYENSWEPFEASLGLEHQNGYFFSVRHDKGP